MKHPVANIKVEGQGWNPYAIAAEGKEAFTKRVIADGHYQRGDDGIGLTEDQRKAIAENVYTKSAEYVAKHAKQPEVSAKKESKA